MEKKIFFFVFIFCSSFCISQNELHYYNLEQFKTPKIDKKYLKAFPLKEKQMQYDSFQNELKKTNRVIDKKKDNYVRDSGQGNYEERISPTEFIYWTFRDSLSYVIDTYNTANFKFKELHVEVTVHTMYEYYNSGALTRVGFDLMSNLAVGIDVGTHKLYDEKGKLIKKINFDKHFKLKFVDIIKIGYDNLRHEQKEEIWISRSFNKKEAYWIIEFKLPDDNFFNKYLIINDRTKKLHIEYYEKDVEKYRFQEYQDKLKNFYEILNTSSK